MDRIRTKSDVDKFIKSSGTKNCVKTALKQDKPVFVTYSGDPDDIVAEILKELDKPKDL